MKSIGMLSMVALFALVMEGSASTLASTFGEEDEGWGGEGGGHMTWQRFGGDPGGFLEGEGDDGWSYRSPGSWSGDWSRYVGGVLSFDLRLIASGGSGPEGMKVRIHSSDGTVLSTSSPPPERCWERREVVLNATNFAVPEADFRRTMRYVDGISIGVFDAGKASTLGLDDVVVAPPSGLDLATNFDDGDGEWRPEGDVSISWVEGGGNGGGFLSGRDLGDGSTWYFASPRSWSGDWTPYVGGSLTFDLKVFDSGKGKAYEADLVKIFGSDGSEVTIPPSPSGMTPEGGWTHHRFDLTPAAFGTTDEAFSRVMRSVDRVVIRGEYSDRGDLEGIDNVLVSLPVATDLVSTFDLGDEGWREGRDVALSWGESGGDPGGYLRGEDQGSGQTWYYVSPPSWSGDWTGYIGGTLSFEIVEIESGNGSSTFGDVVRIYGRDGSYLSWSSDPPGKAWTRRQVSLVPSSFKEGGRGFEEVMKDVSEVWIRGEYSNMRDVGGLDNVMVTLGPGG
ncbi:MAG: hypothetical protein A4E50_00316 [Methanosaeta sp. PtaB.Bin087]|nr:MAG: hypothetical protein A4E50_00316 [Methanosaeta sp. PtaB.Bin087]